MKAEIIYNPSSGQVVVRHELKEVVALLTHQGWCVTLRETSGALEATHLARQAVERGAGVVIAAGGDGTVNEVANGLVDTGAALGVLPVGTSNSWALQMGIPALKPMHPGTSVVKLITSLEDRLDHPLPGNYYRNVLLNAARVLVGGRVVPVDVGEVSGRYFLMWAGIGIDAAVIESVTLKEKKALGSWAFVFKAIGSGMRYSDTDVTLNLDEKIIKLSTPLMVVSNIQLYGGVMAIGARAYVNDGKLDLCIFKGQGFFTFVNQALEILTHHHLQDAKVDYYQCSEISIESARPLPVHLDGDLFTRTPVSIRTLPSALKVIIPEVLPVGLLVDQPAG
ncbi:MAG: diacylglycerol kinase family lipid kinase [Dehalococcoidaceae bacterium]|nr:diacylglycerol kinase family lipid kinase [Dehalococcoidaceae bacterium]